ncbi:NHL repeat-containing protein [Croceiramulus getboli]|nr:NHL repeat-containing protein [Flavobacteriaceae bacterium YJPT1-3]
MLERILYFSALLLLLASCQPQEKTQGWTFEQEIIVEGVNPIGIAMTNKGIWLSDGDHNRVVRMDSTGLIKTEIDSLDRPMHISGSANSLLIPQYGNDEIVKYSNEKQENLALQDSLDAPAGVSHRGSEIAIADFYNHRILYTTDGTNYISFGQEGKEEGDFYYPTDVQLTGDKIYVADAYNNRAQVFDKSGRFLLQMGQDDGLNAATGIYVSEAYVFLTDFENSRVLVFDLGGNKLQELSTQINKPTDLLVINGKLYVTNYKGSSLSVYLEN